MHRLSISRAWDETKHVLSHDGRLIVSVALALIVLPALIAGIINPRGMADTTAPSWTMLVGLIVYLVTLAGQLGIIRLALGPSITVGGAIAHGMRRMPIYLIAALLIVFIFAVAAVPFAVVLRAMGVPLNAQAETQPSPATIVAMLLYSALLTFVLIRLILSAPVASAEERGPIAIIKRSWELTAGHFWQLFGFMLMFFVAVIAVTVGVGAALGVAATLLLGPIEPMSLSALIAALVQALLGAALTTLLAVMLARIYVQLAGRDRSGSGVPTTGA